MTASHTETFIRRTSRPASRHFSPFFFQGFAGLSVLFCVLFCGYLIPGEDIPSWWIWVSVVPSEYFFDEHVASRENQQQHQQPGHINSSLGGSVTSKAFVFADWGRKTENEFRPRL